jgi:peptidyl-prolyl cis-trans isomerase SurA
MKYLIKISLVSSLMFLTIIGYSQGTIIDEIVAVVGDEIITKSEIEIKNAAIISQNLNVTDNTRCEVLEEILYTKMLLNQAKIDSVDVSDGQVEGELDRRIRYYVSQFGSEQAMETYYKKPLSKIKEEMRGSLKDQLLVQTMQGNLTSDVHVTPEEVHDYYNGLDKDSIPLINAEVEVAQIVAYAPTSEASIKEVKDKLRAYKKRILEGEKFSTIAVLYSDDTESAKTGGEIGFVGRAEVEPEFSAAAFALKSGQVSPIIKTRFGYHIIQLIERRGTKVNVRHILLKPKMDQVSMNEAKSRLDSIAKLINSDSLSFEQAAKRFSDDDETKKGGGIIVNPYTSSSLFAMDDLDPATFFVIDKMEEGEMSTSVLIQDPRSKKGYKLILLKKRTNPHVANLKQDYQKVKDAALAQKEQMELENWIKRAINNTYFKIDKNYLEGCKFEQDWSQITQ